MVHRLKIHPDYFEEVAEGRKAFEIRKDDRNYNRGDVLELEEFSDGEYTGRACAKSVSYCLRHASEYGLKKGYVILSLK